MHVVYVTAGTVGAGHHVRGMALRRALARAGAHQVSFTLVAPPHAFVALPPADATYAMDPEDFRTTERAANSALARTLKALQPDLLVVDLFWLPLQRILESWPVPAWLLLRAASPRFLAGPPGLPFAPARWSRRIAIEPAQFPFATESCEPVVVCNPDESAPAGTLHAHLAAPPTQRLHVIAHAGVQGEIDTLAAHARTLDASVEWRALDLGTAGAPFPAARVLGEAAAVVLGAGYNATWEARWMGYHARAGFVPFTRAIDDQAWRLRAASGHVMPANGADVLARWIIAGG